MTNQEWFSSFIENKKEEIVSRWLAQIEKEYPRNYNLKELRANGEKLFDLFVDIKTPLEEHKDFDSIRQICIYHIERGTPFEHVLHSAHIWREAIMFFLWPIHFMQNPMVEQDNPAIPMVNIRIDEVQRKIGKIFAEYSYNLINQKDNKIRSLHNDRLSMLGKMGASMAHEIRNPLTVIEGFLKLVRINLSKESIMAVSKYLSIIDHEFDSLSRQISGFLSFSKNNGIEEPLSEYESKEYIQTVVELISPRCSNENVELILLLEDDFTLNVQKIAVQQVLLNLLNNAIDELQMIGGAKQIVIRSYEDKDAYYISVKDNGNGIPEEIRDSIFDPFTTGKQNGTGLGLSICKRIMEKNNGSISFTSKKGETIFVLSLNKSSV
jgi:two-component system, sporulation sensor kinase D